MKRLIFLLTIHSLYIPTLYAQQALWGAQEIISPDIHDNKTVTFQVDAPQAKEVRISGDWLPAEGWQPGSVALVKNEQGLWVYTTEILEPELYSYSIIVDGFRALDPNNVFMNRDVATVTNFFIIPGDHANLYRVNDVPHGSVTRRWYDSPGLEKRRRITIYTPPGYETDNKEYPVLYLLHGAGGDEEAWISLGRTAQIMDNLMASHEIVPMIVVMPNGNVSQEAAPGEGSRGYYKPQFMVPGTMDGTYEQNFMDIVQFVESSYRVKKEKAQRAVAGLSMGGFHSLHISRYYENMFDYIGLFSPAILPQQGQDAAIYRNIYETLNKQRENGYKMYWIAIGKEDFLYPNVTEFRKKLDSMGMRYTYIESEGGHIWKNWRVYLKDFTPLLFR